MLDNIERYKQVRSYNDNRFPAGHTLEIDKLLLGFTSRHTGSRRSPDAGKLISKTSVIKLTLRNVFDLNWNFTSKTLTSD